MNSPTIRRDEWLSELNRVQEPLGDDGNTGPEWEKILQRGPKSTNKWLKLGIERGWLVQGTVYRKRMGDERMTPRPGYKLAALTGEVIADV